MMDRDLMTKQDLRDENVQLTERVAELEKTLANRRELHHVDATPDEDYPLRILRAHRASHEGVCSDNLAGLPSENPVCILMNEANEKRLVQLDAAIARLQTGG